MQKLNITYGKTKQIHAAFDHIIESVRLEDDCESMTARECSDYIKERIQGEGFQLSQKSIKQWLMGLAINIDYTYVDAVKNILSWNGYTHVKIEEVPDNQFNEMTEKWWDVMAMRTLQLASQDSKATAYFKKVES